MSIGAGSLTLSRIQVLSEPGSLNQRDVIARLQEHAIQPIAVDETTEESIGWCHPHTGEPNFEDASEWFVGDCLIVGLRMDTKKVPGTLYRLQLRQLLTALEQNPSSGSSRASKKDPDGQSSATSSRRLRERAKERVKNELLKRTLPNIRLTEVVWQMRTNEIWLTSASSAVFRAFDECFVKSFGLPYVHRTAGTFALDFEALLRGAAGAEGDVEKLIQAVPWGTFGVDDARDSSAPPVDVGSRSARAGAQAYVSSESSRGLPASGSLQQSRKQDDEEAPF
jgi:hypothetical protein